MICPDSLAVSVSAAAVAIAQGKTPDEIGLLSVVFVQLGDTLATIAEARQFCADRKQEDST